MPVIQNHVGLAIDRIVLATDMSPVSEMATAYARELAKHFSANLTLVHVVDPSVATRSEKAVIGVPLDDVRRNSSEHLERLLQDLALAGVRATGQTLEAHNPAAAIVGLSEQLKVDLIVAGTHSRHGLSKAILGSCAEGIIRHARCPVLTVGPKAKASLKKPFSFNTIVFATDFDSDVAEKASIALAFAQANAAKIYLCHVLDQPGGDISETLGLQLKFEAALEKLIPQSSYDWCTPQCVVEQGDAASHVLRLAKKVGADLIILGAKRSSSWLAHLVEGVVGHVLIDAECPVITVCAT
jgi:nucleotide-binding universal stress UspA family protein